MRLGQLDVSTFHLILDKLTSEGDEDVFDEGAGASGDSLDYLEESTSRSFKRSCQVQARVNPSYDSLRTSIRKSSFGALHHATAKASRPSSSQSSIIPSKTTLLNFGQVPYILSTPMGLPLPMLLTSLGSFEDISPNASSLGSSSTTCSLPDQVPPSPHSLDALIPSSTSPPPTQTLHRRRSLSSNPTPPPAILNQDPLDSQHPNVVRASTRPNTGNSRRRARTCSTLDIGRLPTKRPHSEWDNPLEDPNMDQNEEPKTANDGPSMSQYIDSTMRIMDHLFSASFYDYLKDETNALHIARHLSAIVTDFGLRRVAIAIRWLVAQWSLENVHLFLRRLTQDWYPDVAAMLIALVTSHWPIDPELTFLVARLLRGETSFNAALFLKTLGTLWQNAAVEQELIWKVSCRLRWDDHYYQAFVNHYLSFFIMNGDEPENDAFGDSSNSFSRWPFSASSSTSSSSTWSSCPSTSSSASTPSFSSKFPTHHRGSGSGSGSVSGAGSSSSPPPWSKHPTREQELGLGLGLELELDRHRQQTRQFEMILFLMETWRDRRIVEGEENTLHGKAFAPQDFQSAGPWHSKWNHCQPSAPAGHHDTHCSPAPPAHPFHLPPLSPHSIPNSLSSSFSRSSPSPPPSSCPHHHLNHPLNQSPSNYHLGHIPMSTSVPTLRPGGFLSSRLSRSTPPPPQPRWSTSSLNALTSRIPACCGLPPASSLDFMKNLSMWDMDGLLMTTPPSPPSPQRSSISRLTRPLRSLASSSFGHSVSGRVSPHSSARPNLATSSSPRNSIHFL